VCHERTIDFERHSCIAVPEYCIYNSAEIKSHWSAGQAMCLNGSSRYAMFPQANLHEAGQQGWKNGLEQSVCCCSILQSVPSVLRQILYRSAITNKKNHFT